MQYFFSVGPDSMSVLLKFMWRKKGLEQITPEELGKEIFFPIKCQTYKVMVTKIVCFGERQKQINQWDRAQNWIFMY